MSWKLVVTTFGKTSPSILLFLLALFVKAWVFSNMKIIIQNFSGKTLYVRSVIIGAK